MKAIEEYELAAAEFPDDVTARSGLAFAFYQAGRLREALREYRRLCELRPDDPTPMAKLGEVLEKLGRTSDAAEVWTTCAGLCARQNDGRRSLEAWKNAVRLEPRSKAARLGLAAAYSSASMAAEAAKEQLEAARLFYDQGDVTRALRHCQRALELDSQNRGAQALLERLASGSGVPLAFPMQGGAAAELGPVSEAVRGALAALADDLLAEGGLPVSSVDSGAERPSAASNKTDSSRVGPLLAKAIDLHARGLKEEALGYYEKVLHAGLGRVEILLGMGVLCQELSRWEEASKYLQGTLQSPEYSLAGHLALGQCYWAMGQPKVALDHFLEALAAIDVATLGDEHAEEVRRAYERLAATGLSWGDARGSEQVVDSLLSLLVGSGWRDRLEEARRRLRLVAEEGSLGTLPEVLHIPGGDDVVECMVTSREFLSRGMPFSAVEECYRAIRLAPTYLPLHLWLAQVFAEQGKADEAVSKYMAIAEAYLCKEDPARAIEVYGKALAAAPMAISVREKLIDLLIAQGEIDRALEEYLVLAESYYRLARVDSALSKYEEALAASERTKAPAAWRARILHRVADLQMQRVRWNEAAALYEEIASLFPDDEEARCRLVEVRYRLGQEKQSLEELDDLIVECGKRNDYEGLIKTLRELVASHPQDLPIRTRLSSIYVELGMKAEAIAELDVIGELQLEAGRKKEAVRTLQTIISLEPDEKDGYTQLLRELEQGVEKG